MIQNEGMSVSAFVLQLKDVVDHHPSFNNVTLIGELSNFKAHSSGHFYFTLKDATSRINAVMFKTSSRTVGFNPKDGDQVYVSGKVEVYATAGTIQLYANAMTLAGLGDLYADYEARKMDYQKRGYFDVAHKKDVPKYPKSLAVIVGANSAAYHDISRTLSQRWPYAHVDYFFATVQGKEAASSIVTQLTLIQNGNYDAVIMARGGGSIEDLWGFNEDSVVEAVHQASIPIVSGVGHESDVTLVDFVADYRAATPTAAAVALVPNATDVFEEIRNFKNQAYLKVKGKLQRQQTRFEKGIASGPLQDPIRYIERKQMNLDYYQAQILKHTRHFDESKRVLNEIQQTLRIHMQARLQTQAVDRARAETSLLDTLNRRFERSEHRLLQNQQALSGAMRQLNKTIGQNRDDVMMMRNTITNLTGHSLLLNKNRLSDIIKYMRLLNPAAKMAAIYDQGFAKILSDKSAVTSIETIEPGDLLDLQFKDGSAIVIVERKEKIR